MITRRENGRPSETVMFRLDDRRLDLASNGQTDELAEYRRRIRELTGNAIPIEEETDGTDHAA